MSRILVTGATGTVGSALTPALLEDGHDVRVLTRDAGKLAGAAPWSDGVEVAEGDASDSAAMEAALAGRDAAYYLVHGLSGADERTLVTEEVTVAETFRAAAERAGVGRIVYLGGIVPRGADPADLSPHLRSRYEVGRTLAAGAPELVELRAAMVIGPGSASYRMLEAVATRLPITPRSEWTGTRTQPLALRDAVVYLRAALELTPGVYEVGGRDVVAFHDLVRAYREAAGMGPLVEVDVPFLPKELASPVTALLADLDPDLARSLLASADVDTVVSPGRDVRRHVDHEPLGLEEMLELARA